MTIVRGAAALAVLAGLACGGDGVPRSEAGLEVVRLEYREEHPRERTVELTLGPTGRGSLRERILRPECAQDWDARCWSERTRPVQTDALAVRVALDVLVRGHLPHHETVAPGEARIALTAHLDDGRRIEIEGPLDVLGRDPGLARVRGLLGVATRPDEF